MRPGLMRRARRGLAALAAAAVLMLMAAGPASAVQWNDSGPGTSSGGSGGPASNTGGLSGVCGYNVGGNPGSLYAKIASKWRRYWDYGFPSCVGEGAITNYTNTGLTEMCPTGFLVYRFYGSLNDPAAAVTRSRLNLTSWCAPESSYSFFGTNAMDSGAAPTTPWAASQSTSDSQALNWQDSQVVRSEAGTLTSGNPTQVTSTSCTSLQTQSFLRNWWDQANESERVALRATLGADYWQASSQGRYPATGAAEAGIGGSISGYRFSWSAWKADTSKAPTADPNGDAYYLTSFDWENRGCASPFQFLNNTATPAGDRTFVGTCYIPLVRERLQIQNKRSGAYLWKWPSLQHDVSGGLSIGAGERLSLYYRTADGGAYTPAGSGGDSLDSTLTGLSPAQQTQMVSGWRDAMVNDYKNWWNGQSAQSGLGVPVTSSGAQVVPVNAYASDYKASDLGKYTAIDEGKAASELWNAARCRVATSVAFDTPTPVNVVDPHGSVNLDVANQDVYQVSSTEAIVKVSAGALTCNGACPAGAQLRTLSWSTTPTALNGYKLCEASGTSSSIPMGCDGIYWGGTPVTDGNVQSSVTYHLRFAHPTAVSQAVRFTVADMAGTYSQVVETTGMQIHGVSPITGSTYTIDTGPLHPTVTRPLTITATGSPVALTKSGSSYQFQTPVVGAVQVPTLR